MTQRHRKLAERSSKSVALLALGACLTMWLASPGDAHSLARGRLAADAPLGGLNIVGGYPDPPDRADGEIAALRKLNARVVRTEVRWSALEPLEPGKISPAALAFTDRLVADAADAGIRVVIFVDSTPCWASSAPASLLRRCVPGKSSKATTWPPRDPAAYAAVVAYLARRYGTRLAAIEVWNEPDQANQKYFAGPDKPRRYAALLRAAYPAIKRASPRVSVLGGSLVGSNGVFLQALYAAGIKGYYDGLAVHFYNLPLASLRAFREVQLANGDAKPLWLNEFGWSSCYPKHTVQQEQPCVTAQIQGRNLADILRSLARTPYVAAEIAYELQDSGEEQFGLLTAQGARKPAFGALAKILAWPFGAPSPVTLSLRRRAGQVVASGSGPIGDYMQLEAFEGSLLRYRALFTLDRLDRYSIALPRVLGARGLRVRVYQYWAGLSRAAQKNI
jgi:polysaccharide biosynthesis protein PslG